jgi:hypothetical protein
MGQKRLFDALIPMSALPPLATAIATSLPPEVTSIRAGSVALVLTMELMARRRLPKDVVEGVRLAKTLEDAIEDGVMDIRSSG